MSKSDESSVVVDHKLKQGKVKCIHEQVYDEGRWWFRTEWAGRDKKGRTWPHEWLWEEDLKDNTIFLAWVAKHPKRWIFFFFFFFFFLFFFFFFFY